MRIIVVVGARPNIVKVAPLIPALAKAGITADVAFTGSRTLTKNARGNDQHGTVSFHGITIPTPTWFLDIGEGTNAVTTGAALVALEELLAAERPDAVLAVGDVDPTLALVIAAAKLRLPVAHLEAGMRCGNLTLPDEINRVLISRVASLHLACDETSIANLTAEGIDPERIVFVGSMLAESVICHAEEIRKLDAAASYGLTRGAYVLAGFHRVENLSDHRRMQSILDGLGAIDLPVLLPDAAGVGAAVEKFGLRVPSSVRLVDPVNYHDMLALLRDAAIAVTDSSGVQEETCMLDTPCVTVRPCTERAAPLKRGANRLCDASVEAVVSAVEDALAGPRRWLRPKRWDKAVSQRVVRSIKRGVPPLGE